MKSFLAIDLGASGGKAFLGKSNGERLEIVEIHRFENVPITIGGHMYWDILFLYRNIVEALTKAVIDCEDLVSVGIDSWGVDFGLIDEHGFLVGNPFHYRDMFKTDIMERTIEEVGKQWIFARCPTQFQPYNTLYQLIRLIETGYKGLQHADCLLPTPSLLSFFLSGDRAAEFTMATTTQMFNPLLKDWDPDILNQFQISRSLLPSVVPAGTVLGEVLIPELKRATTPKVVLPTTHDTAAAVTSIPGSSEDTMFVSTGTWCLAGIVTDAPVRSPEVLEYNFANEGSWDGKNRLLANVTGLWLLQRLRKEWSKERQSVSYEQLTDQAEKAKPFSGVIDVNDYRLQNPLNMEEAICQQVFQLSGCKLASKGEIVRTALEGIALRIRWTKDCLENMTGGRIRKVHMVGGGIRNQLLCQFVANATGCLVETGPVEASATGNLIAQMIATGYLENLTEGQQLVRDSISVVEYTPQNRDDWEQHYQSFRECLTD